MLTIFTIPKAFKGDIKTIQRNAIKSWLQIKPKCEIILLGDDAGIKETAEEFGIQHIAQVEKSKFGTPLLNSAFNIVQKIAKNDILVYVNADIIFASDIISAVKQINKPLFLTTGQRWDLDVKEEVNFNEHNWKEKLKHRVNKQGKLHGFSGIDYFVFPRDLPHNLPAFMVGRIGWDNWFIYHMRCLKIPVIDATKRIFAIHQNHDFSHSSWAEEEKKRIRGPETKENLKLAGGLVNVFTLRDAYWILNSKFFKKTHFKRSIF